MFRFSSQPRQAAGALRYRVLRSAFLSAVASLIAGGAFAQDSSAPSGPSAAIADTTFSVETVTVSGTRPGSVRNVLTSVDILGPEVAQRQNVSSVFKVLNALPGILITDYHQGGTNGSVSFRGFNAEGGIGAVKLLIDGVPSNSNDGFMWMLDSVAALDISTIEVVRGTSDPRYGLYSIAGNVSVVTRQGGNYIDGKTTAGSFGTYEGQAALGFESGKFAQNYAFDMRLSDGYRDHAAEDRESGTGKWFFNGENFRLGTIARYFHAQGEDSGFLSFADALSQPTYSPAINGTDGRDRTGGEFSLHGDVSLSDTLMFSSQGYYNLFRDTRFFRITAAASQQERRLEEDQYGASAVLRYQPQMFVLGDLVLEGGAGVEAQDNLAVRWLTDRRVRRSLAFNRSFRMQVYGGYVQAIFQPVNWLRITPAWRLDWVGGDFTNVVSGRNFPANDYGAISQPKVAAVITPLPDFSVYANYGRTFQVGVGTATYIMPPQNASLDPSINTGWEAGVKYEHGPIQTRVAVWEQTATGEVQQINATGSFVNLGSTRRNGVDAQLSLKPASDLSLWGALSWQRGVIVIPDPTTPAYKGNHIDHVPPYLYSAGIDYTPTETLRFSLSYNGQSKYDVDPSNIHGKYGDYSILNVEAAYRFTDHWEISGEITNLTDNKSQYVYYDPPSNSVLFSPHDGRAVYVNLRATY